MLSYPAGAKRGREIHNPKKDRRPEFQIRKGGPGRRRTLRTGWDWVFLEFGFSRLELPWILVADEMLHGFRHAPITIYTNHAFHLRFILGA